MYKKIFALYICIGVCLFSAACSSDREIIDSSSKTEPSSEIESVSSVESEVEEPVFWPDIDSWQLKLVNGSHPIEADFAIDLTQIDVNYSYEGYRFDSRAVDSLNALCRAANKDGIKLLVISPWRSNEKQTTLFNSKVERVLKSNPHLSRDQAKDLAATVVARPGTSEHQLGLAVDFNSVEETFEDTPEFAWLSKNAQDYGFIMRYPKEKQDLTGVIYEPWHYRYVGVENAKAIKDSGLCLEEFLEKYK